MIDIIVRGRNGHDFTERCMESIRLNTSRDRYRLIYVDDGSDDELEAERVAAMADLSTRHHEPKGAVSATNTGLEIALREDGDYVVVMDNDTRIPDGDYGWLDRMAAEMTADTAAVGATTNYANPPQHILTVPQTYTANWGDEQHGGTKENGPVVWFVSFCVMLRKEALRQCGLWDERYNPGNWEDTDYAMQLRCHGWRVKVARSVYIHHEGHKTFGDKLQELLKTNRKKFIDKWGAGRLWDMGLLPSADMMRLVQTVQHR